MSTALRAVQFYLLTLSDLHFDRHHLWHPYTSLTAPLPVYPVISANGVRIKLADGRELIDGMSSWWCAIHGYNIPELNAAAEEQLRSMSHVMFGGITHQPAIQLGKKLVELLPSGLDRIFLADSGSVSVEVAMKVAVQYQHALGRPEKHKFLTFRGGYHGDTTAAMSVCDPIGGMHHLFSQFLPEHFFADLPTASFYESIPETERLRLSDFVAQHAAQSAAFILEPIVQGAGGMRIYSPAYLQLIRQLCDEHHLLLIADEIATGFGRTGTLFAVEHANIFPDILCIGKALTGGYLSLAAMACTQRVAEVVSNGEAGVLMHGPTFMGNPLACAIAVRNLELLESSPWRARVANIANILQRELAPLAQHPLVKDVRVLGAIGVVETLEPVDVSKAQQYFVSHGVWIRPFRNLLYIMPPYVISEADLVQLS
ncbi:MAG: adenosylmethionine--8-amino-7-oxononanoate transaminase, partial [Bacteroidota bacterium]